MAPPDQEESEKRTTHLLEEAAHADAPAGSSTRKLGDFYAAFMDDASIEAHGLAPIAPELARIAKIADARALATYLGSELRADVDALNSGNVHTDRLFGVYVDGDLNAPSKNAAYLMQGGLGRPDRSYYVDDSPAMAQHRAKYEAHLAAMLRLAKIADPEGKAKKAVALERRIAQTHVSRADAEDVSKGRKTTRGRVRSSTSARPVSTGRRISTRQASTRRTRSLSGCRGAVVGEAALVKSVPLADWKAYLTARALDRHGSAAAQGVLRGALRLLRHGAPRNPDAAAPNAPRDRLMAAVVPEEVGREYVKRWFPASSRSRRAGGADGGQPRVRVLPADRRLRGCPTQPPARVPLLGALDVAVRIVTRDHQRRVVGPRVGVADADLQCLELLLGLGLRCVGHPRESVDPRTRTRGCPPSALSPASTSAGNQRLTYSRSTLMNAVVPEEVGREYVKRWFPAESKQAIRQMVGSLVSAFSRRIDALTWMSDATKAKAKQKLGTLHVGIGYPDAWADDSTLVVARGDAYGNVDRAEQWDSRRRLASIGQPLDRTRWEMQAQVVNAQNLPIRNALTFPAGILVAPFFDPTSTAAANYGSIGAVIGHEISHSFDDQGAKFDAQGRFVNWWTPEDYAHFEASGAALTAQLSTYKPFPDASVDGKLTLGESLADLAGLGAAYDAWRASLNGTPAPMQDGLSGDEQFFLSFAQSWQEKTRVATARMALATDPHAPARFRPLTVRNIDAWYSAFDVQRGDLLFLAPTDRVRVW